MIDKKTLEIGSFSLFLLIIISIYAVLSFQRNSRWASELTLWEDAQTKSPSKSRPYTYAGVAYAKDKRHKEAYNNLSRAVLLNPADIEARYNLSILYMELGRFDLAESGFRKAIESRPELKESYLALFDLYIEQGRTGLAATIIESAASRWPDNVMIRLGLATTFARSGKLKEAKDGYNWVLKRAPARTEAINGLGNIYLDEGNYALALSYYEKSIELRPNDPVAIYNAALVSEKLGDNESAIKYYALFIKTASASGDPYKEAVRTAKERVLLIG